MPRWTPGSQAIKEEAELGETRRKAAERKDGREVGEAAHLCGQWTGGWPSIIGVKLSAGG